MQSIFSGSLQQLIAIKKGINEISVFFMVLCFYPIMNPYDLDIGSVK